MQYILTPHAQKIEPYVWWDGAFTDQELDYLQQVAKNASIDAEIASGANKNIRRSQVKWIDNSPETRWVFKKLAEVVSKLNAQYFNFDLTGFGESIQLTHYDQSEHGMYGWHQDYNSSVSRKLSLVMQLTDPSEYEGGNLEIMVSGEKDVVQKRRGFIVLFPSYVVHQVTPVTQGSRQSLVAWISGPPFK